MNGWYGRPMQAGPGHTIGVLPSGGAYRAPESGRQQWDRLLGIRTTAVDQKHRYDNDTVDNAPAGLRHLHYRQHGGEQADYQHAGNGPQITTAPPQNVSATEDDRRHRRQQVFVPHALVGLVEPSRQ